MNLQEFKERYHAFREAEGLRMSQAIVGAGGSLLLMGLREETQDIDMDVPSDIFEKLDKRGLERKPISDGRYCLKYDDFIDVHIYDGEKYVVINDVTSHQPSEVLKFKERLNRPKDQQDIANLRKLIQEGKFETIQDEGLCTYWMRDGIICMKHIMFGTSKGGRG